MTSDTATVIKTLESVGVRFRIDGDKVKAWVPDPTPPEVTEALESLRQRKAEVRTIIESKSPSHCDSLHCAACYDIGDGLRIHPPKPSAEWLEWLARWQKPKGARVQ